jgi:hypothetical protein
MKQILCHPPKPKKLGVCDREPDESLGTYDDLVDDYIHRYLDIAQAERRFFKGCSLQKAIRYASRCMRFDGKRHGHHRRRSQETLIGVENVLQECAEEMRACDTFHDLHDLIHREIHLIHDVGPLLVYDATASIGAHLGLNPDRIYLHSGTTEGAKALLRIRGRKTFKRSELPSAFMRLRCCEVEDCLCIYKRDLNRLAGQKRYAN